MSGQNFPRPVDAVVDMAERIQDNAALIDNNQIGCPGHTFENKLKILFVAEFIDRVKKESDDALTFR